MSKINFSFVSQLEGGATCTGYVPDALHSKSGVTIATGFDIGQRSAKDLVMLLPKKIAVKLTPYCQLTGIAAQQTLSETPLALTELEVQVIDVCVKRQLTELLQHRYNQRSSVDFEHLPEQAQTVIASVAFQYGNLAKRCPTFWGFVITQNWLAMVNELNNFGDRYTSRRLKEANYFIGKGE
jgi:hypothetical protein